MDDEGGGWPLLGALEATTVGEMVLEPFDMGPEAGGINELPFMWWGGCG